MVALRHPLYTYVPLFIRSYTGVGASLSQLHWLDYRQTHTPVSRTPPRKTSKVPVLCLSREEFSALVEPAGTEEAISLQKRLLPKGPYSCTYCVSLATNAWVTRSSRPPDWLAPSFLAHPRPRHVCLVPSVLSVLSRASLASFFVRRGA